MVCFFLVKWAHVNSRSLENAKKWLKPGESGGSPLYLSRRSGTKIEEISGPKIQAY